jgi:hypothetical protein
MTGSCSPLAEEALVLQPHAHLRTLVLSILSSSYTVRHWTEETCSQLQLHVFLSLPTSFISVSILETLFGDGQVHSALHLGTIILKLRIVWEITTVLSDTHDSSLCMGKN